MSQRISFLSIYLLMLIGIHSCQGQTSHLLTKEQQLRKEMDEWMKPYRKGKTVVFEEWIDRVKNHIDDVWKHPVYRHIDTFFQKHRQQYLRLRKADLARYMPAPELLPEYEQVADFYGPFEDKSFPMEAVLQLAQGVGNFRTLSVDDTRFVTEILSGYALEYLKAEKHFNLRQVINRRMYGELFFADSLQPNQWKITVINRLYALKFKWDITNNHISEPELWVYTGKQQPVGWLGGQFPKSQTPVQQLDRTLSSFRWSLYDDTDVEASDFHRMVNAVPDKLETYYQAHRQDYIQIRRQELSKYPPPDTAYAHTFKQVNIDLQQDLLSILDKENGHYKISGMMASFETEGSYTVHNFRSMLMLRMKNHAEYNLTSWIVGNDVYTNKIRENLWEIGFFYHDVAVRFRWNIATDEISDLRVTTKREIAIDRPVSAPPKTK